MDAERIRFVTRTVAHPAGTGLRLIPFGLWMLVATGETAGWWPVPDLLLIGLVLPVALGVWAVHRHYQRTYGQVVAGKEACRVAGGSLATAGGVMALAVATAAEVAYAPDPSLLGLVMSGVAVAYVFLLYERPYRLAYTVAASLLLLALLLSPLVLGVPGEGAVFYPGGFLFDLYWTLAFVVGGLADHLLVARTLQPAPEGQRA